MNFYRIDGWPVAPAVARDYLRLKAAHDKNCPCGVPLRVNSGYRTRSEQHTTFVRRYRRGATSTTRPPDYRKYQGAWWGRVGGPGVVQSPDVVSNHTRGYALDLNVTSGGVCQRWMLANAPTFGFNWIEGKSAREPWHWCWRIGIRPTASSPDPWEGRGAPDPVRPTDRGMTLQQLLGPSTTGGNSRPAPVPVTPEEEDEDMPAFKIRKTTNTDTNAKKYPIRFALSEATSGYWEEMTDSHAGNMNTLAAAYGTGDAIEQTSSAFSNAREAHAAVRARRG